MPKNVKGGNKHKKMKNNSNNGEILDSDLVLKSGKEQDYGKIEKILGNGRFLLLCNDTVSRLGIIRGKMRKRSWVNLGSIVLYSIRPYEISKVDIIHSYSNTALKILEKRMKLNFNISTNDDDDDIFMTNDANIEQEYEPIPEKQKITNEYYNFSDDSDEENEDMSENIVVDEDFIDDL